MGTADDTHQSGALRVGTWNVQCGRGAEKNARRLEVLSSRRADVWVLTETHDELDLSATHNPVHGAQRYDTPGGRWTTVWTSLPVLETLTTGDTSRCVAVRLDGGCVGEVVVYGTVLPWQHDKGPDAERPAKGWSEFARVTAVQAKEWQGLREQHREATLVVAGDMNHNLGGPHYYGTTSGRALLRANLAQAGLVCLTETENFPPGALRFPPIDHVCAGAGRGRELTARVEGWEKTLDGARLSDHSGVLAAIEVK
jgi:hypothetical protein